MRLVFGCCIFKNVPINSTEIGLIVDGIDGGADVLNNRAIVRKNDSERIMVYNIGIALHDIYFAGKIYNLCHEVSPGISLDPPTEKFWA